jgi:hypothetical protein
MIIVFAIFTNIKTLDMYNTLAKLDFWKGSKTTSLLNHGQWKMNNVKFSKIKYKFLELLRKIGFSNKKFL